MKYIITANKKDGQRIVGGLVTKTKRKSKLMGKINAKLIAAGFPLEELENLYVGVLNKHTKMK